MATWRLAVVVDLRRSLLPDWQFVEAHDIRMEGDCSTSHFEKTGWRGIFSV